MDSEAFNFNPFANVSDNSCVDLLEGCTQESALNYCDLCNVDNYL